MPINRLLRQMQTMRMHMAAVADEYGSIVGFITMDNVVEQLIGAVRDEFDEDEIEIVPEEEGVYKIRGGLPLDRVNRELGLDLESEEVDSLSGLVTQKLGRLLRTGDQAEVEPQEHQMMQRHQAMMAEMNAMDAKLNGLVASMNAATGEAKVTAMAEVVTTLVQQRMTMQDRMMAMQGQTMGHMMQHLTQGMSSQGKASAAMCPLMRAVAGSHQETESAEPSPK